MHLIEIYESDCKRNVQSPPPETRNSLVNDKLGFLLSASLRLIARDKHWIDWVKQRHVSSSRLVIISDAAPAPANWINSQALEGVRGGGATLEDLFSHTADLFAFGFAPLTADATHLLMRRRIWLCPRHENLLPARACKRCNGIYMCQVKSSRFNLFSLRQGCGALHKWLTVILMH